jgi:putative hydrolase of the HAD superfamily
MNEVTTLFWDVGGVILSNGWDEAARARAIERFRLDGKGFEARHAMVFPSYEEGKITLTEYLDRTIFCSAQTFSREEFTSFMLAQSSENADTRAILDDLSVSRRYLMAALNNEGRELNAYRIEKFDLGRNFAAFFTSCYLGLRKPDEPIYRVALEITQQAAARCVFIDDREENLVSARRLGMRAIHFQNAAQLLADLAHNGVRGGETR